MPFSKDEVIFMADGLILVHKKELDRMERAANTAQRMMWRRHGDDLVGVPEVDPECYLLADLKIDRTPSPWWRSKTICVGLEARPNPDYYRGN